MSTVFDYALGVTYEHQADSRATADGRSPEDPTAVAPPQGLRREDAGAVMFEAGLALILDGLALRRTV